MLMKEFDKLPNINLKYRFYSIPDRIDWESNESCTIL